MARANPTQKPISNQAKIAVVQRTRLDIDAGAVVVFDEQISDHAGIPPGVTIDPIAIGTRATIVR